MRGLRSAAACAAVAAYAGLSHYSNAATAGRDLGTALALAPAGLVVTVLAWRTVPPAIAALLCAALAALIAGLWPVLRQNYPLINLVQDSSVYGLLGVTFGRTLMPGRVALCTRLAAKEHGPLGSHEVRYTRKVTAAWTVFFFGVSAISIVLFISAPLRIWSAFINFCVLPLVGAMFVAEYQVRRRVLPGTKRTGLLAALRAYLASSHQEPV
ncbi:MAG TPA: hypothetical protein VKP66_07400 [Steroidobacteraceae bacterium]|nr:hypothetical protein [Steroidobacteraceae bacterium]